MAEETKFDTFWAEPFSSPSKCLPSPYHGEKEEGREERRKGNGGKRGEKEKGEREEMRLSDGGGK